MKDMETHLIQIDWDGPYKITDAPSLMDEETDYGIYQVYGNHPVYGSNQLLYIGLAGEQTFGQRILQHEGWFGYHYYFYIGRLAGQQTPSYFDWEEEIKLAEQLLIYSHTPANNTLNIKSIHYEKFHKLHILNWGERNKLLPEVSGLRWGNALDDIPYDVYRWKEE